MKITQKLPCLMLFWGKARRSIEREAKSSLISLVLKENILHDFGKEE